MIFFSEQTLCFSGRVMPQNSTTVQVSPLTLAPVIRKMNTFSMLFSTHPPPNRIENFRN